MSEEVKIVLSSDKESKSSYLPIILIALIVLIAAFFYLDRHYCTTSLEGGVVAFVKAFFTGDLIPKIPR